MLLSVVIPAYNEEQTVATVIDKVLAVELPRGMRREIIVIDDGSTDGTARVLQPYAKDGSVRLVCQTNQGKTAALLRGMKEAAGDILLIQDADLEYDPAQYPQLLDPILRGQAQVVYGSRFLGTIRDMHFINRYANQLSNLTLRLLYGVSITDINTCHKVFTRNALEGVNIVARNFAFETEVTVKLLRKGVTIKEVPIAYVARGRREGKKITWLKALEMYWPIIRYRIWR